MLKLIYGIAFGQLLAAILIVAAQLTVALICWSLAELAWRSFTKGLYQLASSIIRRKTC